MANEQKIQLDRIMDYIENNFEMDSVSQEIIDLVVDTHPVHFYQIDQIVDGYEKGLSIDEIKIYSDAGLHSNIMGDIKEILLAGDYENTLIKEVYDEIKDDENKNIKLEMATTGIMDVYSYIGKADIEDEIKTDKAEILSNIDKAIEYKSEISKEFNLSLDNKEAMTIVGVYGLSDNTEIKECIKEWAVDGDRSDKINNAGAILNSIEFGAMTKEDVGNDVKSFVDDHNKDMNVVGASVTTETSLICEVVKDDNLLEKIKDFVIDKYDGDIISDKADFLNDKMTEYLEYDSKIPIEEKIEIVSSIISTAPNAYEVINLARNGVDVENLNYKPEAELEIAKEIKEMITDENGNIDPDKVEEFNDFFGPEWIDEKIQEFKDKEKIEISEFNNFEGASEENKDEMEKKLDEKVDNEIGISNDETDKIDNNDDNIDNDDDNVERDDEDNNVDRNDEE